MSNERLSLSYQGPEIEIGEEITKAKRKSMVHHSDSFIVESPKKIKSNPYNIFTKSMILGVKTESFVSDLSVFHAQQDLSQTFVENNESLLDNRLQNLNQRIQQIEGRISSYKQYIADLENQISGYDLFLSSTPSLQDENFDFSTNDKNAALLKNVLEQIKFLNNKITKSNELIQNKQKQRAEVLKSALELKKTRDNTKIQFQNEIFQLKTQLNTAEIDKSNSTNKVNECLNDSKRLHENINSAILNLSKLKADQNNIIDSIKVEQLNNNKYEENIKIIQKSIKSTKTNLQNIVETQGNETKSYFSAVDKLTKTRNSISKEHKSVNKELQERKQQLSDNQAYIDNLEILIKLKERKLKLIAEAQNLSSHKFKKSSLALEKQVAIEERLPIFKQINEEIIKNRENSNNLSEQINTAFKHNENLKNNTVFYSSQLDQIFLDVVAEIDPELTKTVVSRNANDLKIELNNISIAKHKSIIEMKKYIKGLKTKIEILNLRNTKKKSKVMRKQDEADELDYRYKFDTRYNMTETQRSAIYSMILLNRSVRNDLNILNSNTQGIEVFLKSWTLQLDKIIKFIKIK